MSPVETYLNELAMIRSSGEAAPETSYYGPLSALLGEMGKSFTVRRSTGRMKSNPMKLALQQLEAYLWGAANFIRGKAAGHDHEYYTLGSEDAGDR